MKAKQTIQARYGYDYYAKIGAIGGANGTTGGFASELVGKDGLTGRERARKMGIVGGSISRRGPAKKVHGSQSERWREHYQGGR